jgi:hypothetical protein
MRDWYNRHRRVSSGVPRTGKRHQEENAVRKPPQRAANHGSGAFLREEISGWLAVVVQGALALLLVVSVLAATVAIIHGAVPVGEIVSAVSAMLGHLKAAKL